ncbi:MAG TPA: hypothetical protein VEX67_19440, partial [Solirubrobacteraceae bacterium]|nr:hypothetical protein [Solirubrobacteraceae bacterium]
MRHTLALACGFAFLLLPASAGAAITTTNDGPSLAAPLGGGGAITGAGFVELAPGGTPHGVSDAPLGGLPTDGETFAILTSGGAELADDPNLDSASQPLADTPGHGFAGAQGNAYDTSVMSLNLNVPSGTSCMSLDFQFFTEEFPDNVGGNVND